MDGVTPRHEGGEELRSRLGWIGAGAQAGGKMFDKLELELD